MKKLMFLGVAAYAILVSTALAASGSSVAGYGGEGGSTQIGLGGNGGEPPVPSESAGETLPFTGLDLGLLLAGALVLLLVGAGLRRLGRAQSSS